jgi:uncharacterized protein YodC (DUF2158 family)
VKCHWHDYNTKQYREISVTQLQHKIVQRNVTGTVKIKKTTQQYDTGTITIKTTQLNVTGTIAITISTVKCHWHNCDNNQYSEMSLAKL